MIGDARMISTFRQTLPSFRAWGFCKTPLTTFRRVDLLFAQDELEKMH
ncbi:hypothetical protein WG66_004049, partial [Moniliophthora roreri]